MSELPEWVVERCTCALRASYRRNSTFSAVTESTLAEFLAIIEEKAGPGWQIHIPRPTGDDFVTLAQLLEESGDGV